jgi:hypothetical protein
MNTHLAGKPMRHMYSSRYKVEEVQQFWYFLELSLTSLPTSILELARA